MAITNCLNFGNPMRPKVFWTFDQAVTGMAERVVVMNQGAKLVDAPTEEALSDPRVVEVYLGRALKTKD